MEKENFIKSFQGLRGYAILLIFISHCNYIHNKTGGNVFNDLGCLGVSVFIMLSGYLLTMQYYGVDMSKTSVLIKKRLRKFYPLHILTLVAAIPFYMGELFNGESIKQWIAMFMNIFLIQAWAPDDSIYFSYNAVSWYLSVTIFFSLVSVLVIRFFEGLKRNDIYFIMLFIIMFQFVWCKLVQHLCCAHWLIYIFPISRCFDYIAGGGIFLWIQRHLYKNNKEKICNYFLIFAFFLYAILILFSLNSDSEFFLVSLWTFPTIILICSVVLGDENSMVIKKIFQNKYIFFIGNISFEIFLVHQLIIRYLENISWKIGAKGSFYVYCMAFIITVIISYVYHKDKDKMI